MPLSSPLMNSAISSNAFSFDTKDFLISFENYLSDITVRFDHSIRDLVEHVVVGGGKRIRPLLVYTCGAGKTASIKNLLKASTVIEMVHVATLVHDDILDNAELRRNKPTLHSKFGEHTSILLGDALFSFALELATDFPDSNVCRIVSRATRKTCTGEINQTFHKENYELSADEYFSIIQDKTGELFQASCSLGAYLGGLNQNLIDLAGDFGVSLGLNYQIYDDLIDTFGNNFAFGKTLGSDLKAGKLTLPVIRLLEILPIEECASLKSDLKHENFNTEFMKYLGELFIVHNIHDLCFSELESRLSNSKLIASNIPDRELSARLTSFISSFDSKLANLATNLLPNFLALN